MSLKNIQKEFRETNRKELVSALVDNFIFGLLGAVLIVFIAERVDILVLLGYMIYYFFLGRVVNRPKYVTSLGKFIVFPVPTALGAFTGYKIAFYLTIIV
jgi:predicted tellurium resistance membrane protein TerC